MKPFNDHVFAVDFDLAAPALVEASAGTGKTYNIQNLFVRLVVQYGVPVQNILVVTFTEAATHELRERLRRVLTECRDARAADGAPADPRAAQLLALPVCEHDAGRTPVPDAATAANLQRSRLQRALLDFDEAAVFTIHGFCQRILDKYAFECGHEAEAELLADPQALLGDLCRQWWRQHTYAGGDAPFQHPGELHAAVQALLKRPDARLLPEGEAPAAVPAPAGFAAFLAAAAALAECLRSKRNMDWAPAGGGWTVVVNKARTVLPAAAPALAALGAAWTPALREFLGRHTAVAEGVKGTCLLSAAGALAQRLAAGASPADLDLKTVRDDVNALAELADPVFLPGPARPAATLRLAPAASLLVHRQAALVRELAAQFRRQVRERLALTFDAMLGNVREAVKAGDGAATLQTLLRHEFAAVLVDEFQDTDPVQYEIFETLFATGAMPLFYIGDPKQAIYGFRGGDVHTYHGARRRLAAAQPDRIYGLGVNWRSEENLLAAINAVFGDAAPDQPTFLHGDIAYAGDLAPHALAPAKQLRVDGAPDPQPFRLWRCAMPKDAPGQASPFARQVYDRVAEEVVALLRDERLRFGDGRRVQPNDIAILVMAHAEADRLHRALQARGVPAVRQNVGNVFDSDEAAALVHVLAAMAEPGDATAVRTALAGALLPVSPGGVAAFNRDTAPATAAAGDLPGSLADWLALFQDANHLWRESGFSVAFGMLMDRVHMRAWLAGQPDGARRLTNLLQLVDLVHGEAGARHAGPVGLLRWLRLQVEPDTREEDESQELCRETDDDAVNIMTVFKSKGLEFPIVFVPTLWRRDVKVRGNREPMLAYHDPDPAAADRRLILDLDVTDPAKQALTRAERLQEDVRLAYVALTRAVNRVYLVCGDRGDADTCALRRLTTGRDVAAIGTVQVTGHDFTGPNRIPSTPWTPAAAAPDEALETCDAGAGMPRVDRTHGHTSFTALTPETGGPAAVAAVPDARDADACDAAARGSEAAGPEPGGETLYTFPAGAQTGDGWHHILEQVDFAGFRPETDTIVRAELQRGGLLSRVPAPVAEQRVRLTQEMVARVLQVELPPFVAGGAPLQLRRLARPQRAAEFRFDLALRQGGARQQTGVLAEALRRHWSGDAARQPFLDRLAGWDRDIPLGYLTGSIDLLFCHDDRFFIVDWKSNRRGGRPGDFEAAGLAGEMAQHRYFLQYLLYTVAVHGFLRNALADYDYERHFGGVYYLFLRGIEPGTTRGVFADRPARALIEELETILTREPGGGCPA